MIWEIIFWIPLLLIFQSYIFYPLILQSISKNKKNNEVFFLQNENLPFISVIMAVHNEEKIIIEKLRSIFNTTYPHDRFELLVGSDGSTDRTNHILNLYSLEHAALRFFPFMERKGKGSVINRLRDEARGEILIFTDAACIFTPEILFNLVRHFKNRSIGLVATNIKNDNPDNNGITIQEWSFISREIRLKHMEGKIWGTMMGAYGACYAIRNELFTPVPEGYSVDDFYITMKVIEKKFKCILDLDAIGYESIPNELSEEFRRRTRISAGNFQNLTEFYKLLWPPFSGLSFSFLSHKVLRWIGPLLLLLMIFSNIFLYPVNLFFKVTMFIQITLMLIPFLDFLLRKLGLHVVFLRFITYFYSMNLALCAGFFKFMTGSETNVWQPTHRT